MPSEIIAPPGFTSWNACSTDAFTPAASTTISNTWSFTSLGCMAFICFPKVLAFSILAGMTSSTVISAPLWLRRAIASRPSVPQPMTATDVFWVILALFKAWTLTAKGSIKIAFSSARSAGTGTTNSESIITSWANKPLIVTPKDFLSLQILVLPWRQNSHLPQYVFGKDTTLVPTLYG